MEKKTLEPLGYTYKAYYLKKWKKETSLQNFKSTVIKIDKALINDRLHDSKVSWKFRIPTIYNF